MATVGHMLFLKADCSFELLMGPFTIPLYTSPKHPSPRRSSMITWLAGISHASNFGDSNKHTLVTLDPGLLGPMMYMGSSLIS